MPFHSLASAAAALVAVSANAWGVEPATAPLVSTEWLEQNLDRPTVRVVEISVNPALYERGHIPGAANINWRTDLTDAVLHDIAHPKAFQSLLRRSGINGNTVTVLYGDNDNALAAWGAWIFGAYGVNNVKLLDGGRNQWETEGRALSTDALVPASGNITIQPAKDALRARLPGVLAAARQEVDGALTGVRATDAYHGKLFAPDRVREVAVRAGHVLAR